VEKPGSDGLSGIDHYRVVGKIARYCAFEERCIHDVKQKLREWKVTSDGIARIISYLEENDFISQTRYAKSFARGKFHSNKWGRIKIEYELKSRGIPELLIRDALQEIGVEEYGIMIRELILKKQQEIKAGKNLNIREKIITFVTGKGYEFDLIAEALKELKI
jgi:regulatory protein